MKLHPLRAYRIAHGLTAEETATRLDIGTPTLRSYENGHRKVPAEKAVEIERLLGIDRAQIRPDLFERAA